MLVGFLLNKVVGDDKMGRLLGASCYKSVTQMQAWQKKRSDYVRTFRETVWGDMQLDMIVCAAQATPALKIGQTKNLSPLAIGAYWLDSDLSQLLTLWSSRNVPVQCRRVRRRRSARHLCRPGQRRPLGHVPF